MTNIHELIRTLRDRLNETQVQFSIRLGVSEDTVQGYESGRQTPKPSILMHLVREAQKANDNEFLTAIKTWTGGFSEDAIRSVQRQKKADIRPSFKALSKNLAKIAERCDELMLLVPEQAATDKLGDAYVIALGRLGELLHRESARFADLVKMEVKVRASHRNGGTHDNRL